MTGTPWNPPFLAGMGRSDALWNALVSHAERPLPLATKGATATFSLAQAPKPHAPCIAIEPARGPRLYVSWTAFPFAAMFGTDIRVDDLPALPPALRDALTEGMVSLMWDEIPEQRLGGYSLAGSDRLDALASEAERPSLSWFSLVLTGLAKEPVAFQLGCDRSALLDALAGGLAAPRQIHEGLKEHLHAEAAFTLGSARLLISELKALEVGAVIVLPAIDAGVCSVRVEGSVYDFRPNGAGWALVGSAASDRDAEQAIASRGDGSMASEPDEPHGQESAGLSSLPIMIDFDLGRRTVPLSEIESWHAGSIVALDPPPRADGVEVTLRANGRVIGIGDLVRIDDRLAVRLSRLLFTP